jgi:hypothetical protein
MVREELSVEEFEATYDKVQYDKTLYDPFGWAKKDHCAPISWQDFRQFDSYGIYDVSKTIHDTLFAVDNQTWQCIIVGPSGAGKSFIAGSVLWNAAMRMAYTRYGDIKRWREIYDYQRNTAIISPKMIVDILQRTKEKQLYLIDDAFLALDRKDWQSDVHQLINAIFGAERVFNTGTIITVQRSKMIDTILRDLLGYRLDAMRSKGAKKLGFNRFKVFKLELNHMDRRSAVFNIYPRTRGVVWEDGVSTKPPAEWIDWYGIIRKQEVALLKEKGLPTGKGTKRADPVDKTSVRDKIEVYMVGHPVPMDKKQLAKWKKDCQAEIKCDWTYIDKVLRRKG